MNCRNGGALSENLIGFEGFLGFPCGGADAAGASGVGYEEGGGGKFRKYASIAEVRRIRSKGILQEIGDYNLRGEVVPFDNLVAGLLKAGLDGGDVDVFAPGFFAFAGWLLVLLRRCNSRSHGLRVFKEQATRSTLTMSRNSSSERFA